MPRHCTVQSRVKSDFGCVCAEETVRMLLVEVVGDV